MTADMPEPTDVLRPKCPACDAELADPDNPYCAKCDIAWVQCPSCLKLNSPGHGICEDCGMSIADKG